MGPDGLLGGRDGAHGLQLGRRAARRPRHRVRLRAHRRLVRRAALRNQDVLPIVFYAPPWARAYRNRFTSPPKNRADYVTYLAALVERYGPDGTFWTDHPELPKHPLREWQIWNEPHLPPTGTRQRRGRTATRAATRCCCAPRTTSSRASIRAPRSCWRASRSGPGRRSRSLYQHGIKPYFDVAALQIFPQTVKRAVKATQVLPRRDEDAPGRAQADLPHRDHVARVQGQDRGDQVPAPGDAAGDGAKLSQMYRAMVLPAARPGREQGVLVHVVVALRPRREHLQLRRAPALLGRAASRPSPRSAPISGPRGATRAAPRRSPASASSQERPRARSTASAVRCQVSPAARSRPAVDEPVALRAGGARAAPRRSRRGRRDRRAARRRRRPPAARRGRRPPRACPPPSPPRTAGRSPRRATAWRTRAAPA